MPASSALNLTAGTYYWQAPTAAMPGPSVQERVRHRDRDRRRTAGSAGSRIRALPPVPGEHIGKKVVYHGGFTDAGRTKASRRTAVATNGHRALSRRFHDRDQSDDRDLLETVDETEGEVHGRERQRRHHEPETVGRLLTRFTGCESGAKPHPDQPVPASLRANSKPRCSEASSGSKVPPSSKDAKSGTFGLGIPCCAGRHVHGRRQLRWRLDCCHGLSVIGRVQGWGRCGLSSYGSCSGSSAGKQVPDASKAVKRCSDARAGRGRNPCRWLSKHSARLSNEEEAGRSNPSSRGAMSRKTGQGRGSGRTACSVLASGRGRSRSESEKGPHSWGRTGPAPPGGVAEERICRRAHSTGARSSA